MNTKYIWLALAGIGIVFYLVCNAQVNENTVQTHPNWHMLSTENLSDELIEQITRSLPSNSVLRFKMFPDGWAWTTNTEEYWRGIWIEGTNGMRTQLNIVTNASSFRVHVQAGSFKFKREIGSRCFFTPNGKFAKFELVDSNGHVIPPKLTAGTNLFDSVGVYYKTNPPAWAAPYAGSLVADFPEKVSTNVWPLYYKGIGMARSFHIDGRGDAEEICSLNLYDLYSITNGSDYSLTIQPVFYIQKSFGSEFLDRVDLPSVTTKVHLVPSVK